VTWCCVNGQTDFDFSRDGTPLDTLVLSQRQSITSYKTCIFRNAVRIRQFGKAVTRICRESRTPDVRLSDTATRLASNEIFSPSNKILLANLILLPTLLYTTPTVTNNKEINMHDTITENELTTITIVICLFVCFPGVITLLVVFFTAS